jgi:hypothetical protein
VRSLAVGSGVVYAGCSTEGGGPFLFAADVATGVLASWDPGVNSGVNALALNGSTLYVAGGFTQIGGQPQSGIAALTTVTLDVHGRPLTSAVSLAPPVPSPVRTRARIAFTLPSAAVVSLDVYDLTGRRVAGLLDRAPMTVGEHQVEVNAETWPAGCYWYNLDTGSVRLSHKLLVVR